MSRSWGTGANGESDATRSLTNNQLLQHRQDRIDEQNEQLDLLAETVGRITDIGVQIGEEAEADIGLLDELGEKVDHQGARIKSTTRTVDNVITKSSTKCLWTVICVLVLILIAVIVAAVYT